MSKQYYIREGRRFVKADVSSVVDHRGEYYNADGSFSKEKRSDSVGVCVIQNPTECIICGLNEYTNITHNGALCLLRHFPGWRLGKQEEMHIAVKFYMKQLELKRCINYRIRVNLPDGYTDDAKNNGTFYFIASLASSYANVDFSGEWQYRLRLFKTVKL